MSLRWTRKTCPQFSSQHTRQFSVSFPVLQTPNKLEKHELDWLKDDAQKYGKNSAKELSRMIKEYEVDAKPIAYILGSQPFYPLKHDLLIRPPTLIPRPETEEWVNKLGQELISTIRTTKTKGLRILDICSGSGAISLALAEILSRGCPDALIKVLGVDVSSKAIGLAQENAVINNLQHLVQFQQTDIFDQIGKELLLENWDVIVSNPPYIPINEYKDLAPSVKDWEDPLALIGQQNISLNDIKHDGLDFYKRITLLASKAKPSLLAFEVGKGQANAVAAMLQNIKAAPLIWSDIWGVERCVVGKWSS